MKLAGALTAAIAFLALTPQSFAQSCSIAALHRDARDLFAQRHLTGAVYMQRIGDGAPLASVTLGEGPRDLPLSVVKLFLYAAYLDHRRELGIRVRVDRRDLIAHGSDDDGRHLALDLRYTLGGEAVLRDLARFGFPRCTRLRTMNCTTLSPTTPDAAWADALSIGETGFHVALPGVSRFLVAVGNGGERMMRVDAARALQEAMRDTVRTGTASGVRDRLGQFGALGGKTGSGPGAQDPTDGVFAGLAYDRTGAPRAAFVTFVRRGGHGGGAAAEISADLARDYLQNCLR